MAGEEWTLEDEQAFRDATTSGDWLDGDPMDPAAEKAEPLPALAGVPYVYAGSVAMIVGATGIGRSNLLETNLFDAAQYGLRCGYLGSEITLPEFNARAAAIATSRREPITGELRQVLARVRYLELDATIAHAWGNPDAWVAGISERFNLLAIDPLSAVASALDLDFDQKNAEFIRFYDRLLQPLARAGVTILVADNVGHAQEAKRRAKGVSAKGDRADLTFSCSLSATPPGLIVKAHKVRSARAGFRRGDEWIFLRDTLRIEPHGHGDGEDEQAPAFRPTGLMQKVSEALEAEPGLTRNALRTAIRGRGEYVTLAIELLISEGYIESERDGQAIRHKSLKSYREDTESTESRPSPNQVPDPVAETESTESPT